MTSLAVSPLRPTGFPEWIESDVDFQDGKDPLGYETISADGILPKLLPGIIS